MMRARSVSTALLIAVLAFICPARIGNAAPALDESDGWLPEPEEELESPETLEEQREAVRAGALVRSVYRSRRLSLRRVAVDLERGGGRLETGFLFDPGRVRPGARVTVGPERVALAIGRVSLQGLPPLLSEAMGLTGNSRRVPSPRPGRVVAEPSLGASASALDGALVAVGRRTGLWLFGGTRGGPAEGGPGDRLSGIGVRAIGRTVRGSASFGTTKRAMGSVTMAYRAGPGEAALELLRGPGRNAALAEIASRGDRALLSARWRYRSWPARRVTAELSAQASGPGSRVRVTWRSWSAVAPIDEPGADGRLEVEWSGSLRGVAPVRARLGTTGGSGGPTDRPREAYGLLNATLAREPGRSLGVHALRRAVPGHAASATTLGTRLDLEGRLGAHALLVECTRLRRGAPAWGFSLTPSGTVTLRTRADPGIRITARGTARSGRWGLGYTLGRGEGASGPGSWSGTFWLRRYGE